jgi:hypothetical protein
MITKLKRLFGKPKQEKKDFSSFFNDATPEEKRRVMEGVVRKANQDQRAMLKQYEQTV